MIETYLGTIGSGKSYHALETIVDALRKGKYVICNFPLNFPPRFKRKGYADRFMYVPDEFLIGTSGVTFLYQLQKQKNFYDNLGEDGCLVVIDEAGNYFPPEDNSLPVTRLWKLFFTQSRHMGYSFLLIVQDDYSQINKTIRKCVEYRVVHRKINSIFPFSLLPLTIFMYVTFWAQQRQRLRANSTIFVKKFAQMYDTSMMFGDIDSKFDFDFSDVQGDLGFALDFGNCKVNEI